MGNHIYGPWRLTFLAYLLHNASYTSIRGFKLKFVMGHLSRYVEKRSPRALKEGNVLQHYITVISALTSALWFLNMTQKTSGGPRVRDP
jgi:hypothetical protein